jgi:hypothetical protein
MRLFHSFRATPRSHVGQAGRPGAIGSFRSGLCPRTPSKMRIAVGVGGRPLILRPILAHRRHSAGLYPSFSGRFANGGSYSALRRVPSPDGLPPGTGFVFSRTVAEDKWLCRHETSATVPHFGRASLAGARVRDNCVCLFLEGGCVEVQAERLLSGVASRRVGSGGDAPGW